MGLSAVLGGWAFLDLLLEADTRPHIGSEEPTNRKGMGKMFREGSGDLGRVVTRVRVWPCHCGGVGG